MSGYYSVNDIKKIVRDISDKIKACSELGLGDIAHTFNEALNLIGWLWEAHIDRVTEEMESKIVETVAEDKAFMTAEMESEE